MARPRARDLFVVFALAGAAATADAAIITFDSPAPANNATFRASWLTAVGIVSPQYFEGFETGFVNGQDVSGVSGLFPGGLIITDTSTVGDAIVRSGSGIIGGSDPVGVFSLTHGEFRDLQLDFSASPILYLGFLGIDHSFGRVTVTYSDGTSAGIFGISGNNTTEFYGIYSNDGRRIMRVTLNVFGDDGSWGLDNLEYGPGAPVPEPASMLLFGTGLLVLSRAWRKARRQAGGKALTSRGKALVN